MLKICGRCYRCGGTIIQEPGDPRRCLMCAREPRDRLDGGPPLVRQRGARGRLRREPSHRAYRGAA